MKKLVAILAIAVLAAVASTGCSNEDNFGNIGNIVIDNIPVRTGDWRELWVNDSFVYMYADVPIAELTSQVISSGAYMTYFKYTAIDNTRVQQKLPYTEFHKEGAVNWSQTIDAEYSVGYMRITLSISDFVPFTPGETLFFRTVIIP
jgi:hypothetical protein